jgi:hypothetical protein
LAEEKATLEEIVESRDELLMEITRETWVRMKMRKKKRMLTIEGIRRNPCHYTITSSTPCFRA